MKRIFFISLFFINVFFVFADDLYSLGHYMQGSIGEAGITAYNDVIGGTGSKQFNKTILADNEIEEVYTVNNEFFEDKGASVYTPKAAGQYPALLITHGFLGSKSVINYIGKHLATHGFISICFHCKDQKKPFEWINAYTAAYNILVAENSRPESKLFGKIDFNRVGLIGHSMGGASGLHAAMTYLRGKISTVIGLNPYNGAGGLVNSQGGGNEELGDDLSQMTIPTFIITGQIDIVAYPWDSLKFYENLPDDLPAAFACFHSTGHMTVDGAGSEAYEHKQKVLTLITAWFRLFLKGESNYESYFSLNGSEHLQMVQNVDFDDGINFLAPGMTCIAYDSQNIGDSRSKRLLKKIMRLFGNKG